MRKSSFIMDSAHHWALLLAITVPFVTLERLSPVGVTWWGLLSGAVLAILAAIQPASTGHSRLSLLASLALASAAVYFVIRGIFAAAPSVSLFGIIGQHNGAALGVLALCWFLAGRRFSTRPSFRRSLIAISLGGVAYGMATLVEAVSSGLERDWGAVAGVFENSSSLGQYMALAVGTSVAWALISRTQTGRWAGYTSAAFSLGIILLAQSRAGLLGVVIGAGIALAMYAWWPSEKAALGLGAAATADGMILSALFVAASLGSLGDGALRLAAGIGNDRDTIWRSAFAAFKRSPIIGRGLEQFSACVDWSFRGGQLNYYGTSDPHNAVMAALIGGGLLGGLVAAVAAATLLAALVRAFMRSGRSRVLAAAIGGVVAVPATALVTWFAPVAVLASAYLAGAAISLGDSVREEREADTATPALQGVARWLPAVAGGLAFALALHGFAGLRSEVSLEAMRRDSAASADSILELSSWPDPSFASLAVTSYSSELQAAQDAAARDIAVSGGRNVIRRWGAAREWHFDLSIASVVFEQAIAISGGGDWQRYQDAVAAGKQSDPTTGLWDFLGAVAADFLGKKDEASAYAKNALRFPLGPEEESQMRSLAGE